MADTSHRIEEEKNNIRVSLFFTNCL
jgi:hypothetical protein